MRKWFSIVFLTILLFCVLYINSTFTADLFAIVYSLSCSIIIFLFSGKGEGSFKSWKMLSIIPLFWCAGDLLTFLYTHFLQLNVKVSNFVELIYYLPNLSMLIPVIMFLFIGFKRLHRAKFFLDLTTLLYIILGVVSGVLFSHFKLADLRSISFGFDILNIVTDTLSIVAVLLMLSSVNHKTVDRVLYVIGFSFVIFIYADFYHFYESIVCGNKSIELSFHLYYISFYFMTISAMFTDEEKGPYVKEFVQTPENLINTRIVLYIWLLPLFLFIKDLLNLSHFLFISVGVIVYQYINFIIERLYKTERAVVEKEEMMHELESIVDERTKELEISNEALYSKLVTDGLTGLNNREFLIEYLKKAISENRSITLLSMDIDRFKVINDYHGHKIGDRVLKEVAARLKGVDIESEVTARIGGDEFAMVIPAVEVKGLTEDIKKIIDVIKTPITIDEFRFHLEMSIGISRYPKDAETVGELLRYADLAMYYVKNQDSSDEYALFTVPMISKIQRRNHIELLLQNADYDNEFLIYYQPKFDIQSGNIIGMEALLRWNHPAEGMIYPGEFIPIAEETGLILGISDWVFFNAMKQVNAWNRKYDKQLVVSLNVSPISFDSYNFVSDIKNMIVDSEILPQWVEFEVTEHIAMEATSKIENVLDRLKSLGVQLSIDDFGTGYSSLSYMKRFDIDVLKIARELVMNIVDDNNERLIVQAIITMASGMNDYIIAEGVETVEQFKILKELGCDAVQGYLTGRPVDKETFEINYLKYKTE